MSSVSDLLGQLPRKIQNEINDVGMNVEDVCDAAETYIMELEAKLKDAKSKARVLVKARNIIEKQNDRATRVLKAVTSTVKDWQEDDFDGSFKCDQGSERREFDHGKYCGRTEFANELYVILLDADHE